VPQWDLPVVHAVRAVKGSVPADAQKGLKATFRAAGYFLPCCWRPGEDIEIARIDAAALRVRGRIEALQPLNETVMRVRVTTREPLAYRSGQFLNLVRGDGLTRSYSLASLPGLDPFLAKAKGRRGSSTPAPLRLAATSAGPPYAGRA
jgi:hypothetical protein